MDAPQPELTIDWHHDGFRLIRIFVQDPMDQTTRERLMGTVVTFREITDLDTLRGAVDAIAHETGVISTFIAQPDHNDPFQEWVTIGFRRP